MDVWCVGDLNYFASVLNALAMVAQSGLFNDLIRLGLIIAVLWMGFAALLTVTGRVGSGIPFGQFIMAYIAFELLFGMTTDVTINDTYSLKAMDVDNVPYGVMTAGSMMSKVGHEITITLEQAFSTANMADNGFVKPLEVIYRTKDLSRGLGTLHDGKIKKTITEYMEKCTCVGVNMGQINKDQILTSENPWLGMKWESSIYYAMTWLPSDPEGGTLRSCTEAWDAINTYLEGQMWTDWDDFLQSVICPEASCIPTEVVQEAMNYLGQTMADAKMQMIASVLLPLIGQAEFQHASSLGKAHLVMLADAYQQRGEQWKAEANMYLNIMRPLMAFFEGFLYASAPFMALMVAFVPAGLGLLGKYFMMFAWVQSWMPTLAIINHYTQIIAEKKITAMADGGIALSSLHGYTVGMSNIHDWMEVAGLLTACTPAISLALLYGGSIAVSHLAGRLQQHDLIDESKGAPNLTNPHQSVGVNPPLYEGGTPFIPMHATGAEAFTPKIKVDDVMAKAQSSALTEVQASTQAFAHGFTQAVNRGQTYQSGGASGVSLTDGVRSNLSESQALAWGLTQSMMHDGSISQSEAHKVYGALSASSKIGAGIAGVETHLFQSFGSDRAQQISQALATKLGGDSNADIKSSITDVLARDAVEGRTEQYMAGMQQQDAEELRKSGQQVLSAERRYSETSQAAHNLGFMTDADISRMAQLWSPNLESASDIAQKLATGGAQDFMVGTDKMGNRVNRFESAYQHYKQLYPTEIAKRAALIHRLNEYQGQFPEKTMPVLGNIIAQTLGRNMVSADPGKFKGVSQDAAAAGQQAFGQTSGLAGPDAGAVRGTIEGEKGRLTRQLPGPGVIDNDYDRKSLELHAERQREADGRWGDKHERMIDDSFREFSGRSTTAQRNLEGIMGALRETGSEVEKSAAFGLVKSLKHDVKPEWDFGKLNPQRGMNDLFERMETYGRHLGLDGAGAKLYAKATVGTVGSILADKTGWDLPGREGYDSIKNAYIQSRVNDFIGLGKSPEAAQQMAQKEADMIVASGQSGIDYAARIGSSHREYMDMRRQLDQMAPVMSQPRISSLDRYEEIISDKSKSHGVDANLIRAVIMAESGGDARTVSPKGAMGLMQLMPRTAKDLGVKDPFNSEQNIDGGVRYLRMMLNKTGGDYKWALAAYNAGPHNKAVQSRDWKSLPDETKNYVRSIMGNLGQPAVAMDTGSKGSAKVM
ncbi:MAG TPA: hypothetical protein DCY27_08080 [Desulfobacterales bacterium]|nr:hypothetical protein [Desulfobacterales bacterium]